MNLSNNRLFDHLWLSLFVLSSCFSLPQSKASEVETQIGKKVPTWELVGLDGKNVSSDKFKGKVVVLNFWATWCPPCRAEIPDFMKLHESYKDKNVVVLGVSLDSGLGPVKRFVRTQKLNYPVLMGNGKLVAEWEISPQSPKPLSSMKKVGFTHSFEVL